MDFRPVNENHHKKTNRNLICGAISNFLKSFFTFQVHPNTIFINSEDIYKYIYFPLSLIFKLLINLSLYINEKIKNNRARIARVCCIIN